nr:MAG TPA: hypothetical protein [Caudoviricetes sp.]
MCFYGGGYISYRFNSTCTVSPFCRCCMIPVVDI